MKAIATRLTLFLFLLCSCLTLATEVRKLGATAAAPIVQNYAWSGYTGSGKTFVMDTPSVGSGVCVTFVNNNTTNSRTINMTAATTSDFSTTTFSGNQGAWTTIPISPPQSSYTVPAFSGSATGTLQVFLRTLGAVHYAFTISGQTGTAGGSPDTVNIFYSWTGTQCGAANQWSVVDAPANATACNSANGVIAGVAGVRHVANCVSVGINTGVATPLASNFSIRESGVAGNCTSGTIRWSTPVGVPGNIGASDHIAVCGLNISAAPGNSLQVCFEATPGTTQACRSSMSGYDQ